MKIEGVNSVKAALRKLAQKYGGDRVETVQVGYTQRYALYVHEDLNAHHAPGKQAKYLEAPARRLERELGQIVAEVTKKSSLQKGLLVAGLRLQRESQLIVPVDTSALKASAYTALEKDADSASAAAFAKSEAIRTKGNK